MVTGIYAPVFSLRAGKRRAMNGNRRKFRNVLCKLNYVAGIQPVDGRPMLSGPLFDMLGDDVVLHLLIVLSGMKSEMEGLEWQNGRYASARSVYSLCTTCSRLWGVLDGAGELLHSELIARGATDVCPRIRDCDYPYAAQRLREKTTMDRVRVLRGCETSMAFHCASSHCAAARRDACRDHGYYIKPIESARVNLISSATKTGLCYASVHTILDSGRAQDVIRLVNSQGHVVAHDVCGEGVSTDGFNTPLYMSASPNGSRLAYIFSVDELVDVAAERLAVWNALGTGQTTLHGTNMPAAMMANEGVEEGSLAVVFPQSVWWTDGGAKLVVAWSTTFVHPSGIDGQNGDPVEGDERYMLCTYDVTDNDRLEYLEASGPFFGRLMAVSTTESGDRAVALVRQRPRRKCESHYRAVVHYQGQETPLRHPSIWKGKGKRGSDGFDWGPSAVGISPMGDAVVCVHRTLGSVIVEVLDLDREAEYFSTNSRDITEWFSRNDLTEDDLLAQWYEQDDEDDEDELPNKVKLPYAVGFSDCGSFASIVDRRPIHGTKAPYYSTVLVNVTHRRMQRELKAVPLFRERHSIAKALEWRACGVWTQSRRGAVVLTEKH